MLDVNTIIASNIQSELKKKKIKHKLIWPMQSESPRRKCVWSWMEREWLVRLSFIGFLNICMCQQITWWGCLIGRWISMVFSRLWDVLKQKKIGKEFDLLMNCPTWFCFMLECVKMEKTWSSPGGWVLILSYMKSNSINAGTNLQQTIVFADIKEYNKCNSTRHASQRCVPRRVIFFEMFIAKKINRWTFWWWCTYLVCEWRISWQLWYR